MSIKFKDQADSCQEIKVKMAHGGKWCEREKRGEVYMFRLRF